jgi:hypothetical protein
MEIACFDLLLFGLFNGKHDSVPIFGKTQILSLAWPTADPSNFAKFEDHVPVKAQKRAVSFAHRGAPDWAMDGENGRMSASGERITWSFESRGLVRADPFNPCSIPCR